MNPFSLLSTAAFGYSSRFQEILSLFCKGKAYFAHTGDSRLYWITPSSCQQVTVDALAILGSEHLQKELKGPSKAPPPPDKTAEDLKSQEEAIGVATLLSLQSETAEPGTFIVEQKNVCTGVPSRHVKHALCGKTGTSPPRSSSWTSSTRIPAEI